MTRDRKKRARIWFDWGARAMAAVRPDLPQGYGCPLCLRLFPTLDGLSEDDVPPKSVGGRPLLLTCTECNSRSGHELDCHIRAAADIRAVGAGDQFIRGRFTQYGHTLNADISLGPKPEIRILEANNPATNQAMLEELQRSTAAGSIPPEITLGFQFRYNPQKERVAWLRVGYLYAFAALGYCFALRPVMKRIHEQFRSTPDHLPPGLVRRVSPPVPSHIVFVREPESFRSILVSTGDWLTFFPGLRERDDSGFYERMAATSASDAPGFKVTGLGVDLPRRPVFRLDLDSEFRSLVLAKG